jgi:hypothetical protein
VLIIAGIIVAFAAAFVIAGFPLAVTLRYATEGWVAAVADSLLFGLVVVTVGVTLFAWLGWVGAALALAGWAAAVVVAVRRRELPSRGLHPTGRVLMVAWILLFAVAFVVRLHSVNFLPWVGDMGAYVNWANAWQVRGYFVSSWPPLFGAFLSIAAFFFGAAHTTSAVGISGVVLLVAVARLLHRLGVHPWVAFGATALLALHQHAVWFSTFPGSESLNAPLFIIWILLLHACVTSVRARPWAAVAMFALTTLALIFLRGSGALLLIPLIATVVLTLIVPEWRRLSSRFTLATAGAVLGTGIGYWYGVAVIPRYFVSMQVKGNLPDSVSSIMEGAGLLSPTVQLAVVLIVAPVALVFASVRMERWGADPVTVSPGSATASKWNTFLPIAVATVFVVGVIGTAVVGAMSWAILVRLGPWLMLGAIAIFVLPIYRKLPAATQAIAVLLMGTNVMFIALHTVRLGFDRGHSFYLYWDRYLVSEYLPAVVVLSAVAISVCVPWIAAKKLTFVAAIAAGIIIVAPATSSLILQSQDTYMAGAFEFTTELIGLQDDSDDPIVWSSSSENAAPGFFFPNTWMAFGLPIKRSFGYDVLNASQRRDNFAPDEVLTYEALEGYALCSPDRSLTVYETETGGPDLAQRLTGTDAVLSPLGTLTSSISLLAQPANAGWTQANITVDAWTVTMPASADAPCEAPRR